VPQSTLRSAARVGGWWRWPTRSSASSTRRPAGHVRYRGMGHEHRPTGQTEGCQGAGRSTPYAIVDCSVVPLRAAMRWEQQYARKQSIPLGRLDAEACFTSLFRFFASIARWTAPVGLMVETEGCLLSCHRPPRDRGRRVRRRPSLTRSYTPPPTGWTSGATAALPATSSRASTGPSTLALAGCCFPQARMDLREGVTKDPNRLVEFFDFGW
jgi:hypothetical protein